MKTSPNLIAFFRTHTDAVIKAFFQTYFDAGDLQPLRLIAEAFIPGPCDCKLEFMPCHHKQADPDAQCDCNPVPVRCEHVLNPEPLHLVLSPDVQTFLAWLIDSAKDEDKREFPEPASPGEHSEVIEREDYLAVMESRADEGKAIQTLADWAIMSAVTEDQGDKSKDLARLGQPRRNNGTDKPSLFIAEKDAEILRFPNLGCRGCGDKPQDGNLCSACEVADRRLRRPVMRPRLAEAA